jgi:hypothetical protein
VTHCESRSRRGLPDAAGLRHRGVGQHTSI